MRLSVYKTEKRAKYYTKVVIFENILKTTYNKKSRQSGIGCVTL